MTTITRDWQALFEGLLLGGDDYELLGIEGLGLPSFRTSDTERPLEDGAFAGVDLLAPRTVTLDVGVAGGTHDDIVARLEDLKHAFRPRSELLELRLQLPGQLERVLFGRPRGAGFPLEGSVGGVEVACRVKCPDPRIYTNSQTRKATDLPSAEGERSYDLTFDRVYGEASTGGAIVATNPGNVDTNPTFEVTGRVAGPVIRNASTGQRLAFDLTVESGQRLVVDTYERTAKLDGLSRYAVLSADSEWIVLSPGSNDVRFGQGHGDQEPADGDSGRLQATWRGAYL